MIRVGIVGYGNLGKGVEASVHHSPDMELVAVFTRRAPDTVKIRAVGVPVLRYEDMERLEKSIDVMILCGGSATDLPEMTPEVAAKFHVVDSFDNHSSIPAHFARVDEKAKVAGKIAVISSGWDPGLFSINRLYANAILPRGRDYTFWGKGVSQGHSDAIRRISGVADARQYTVPVKEAVARVRRGENPELSAREKHTRECFVVAEKGANLAEIEEAIVTMPGYFADYDTAVTFISREEMARSHSSLPHGGNVIRSGTTGWEGDENGHTIEYQLSLDSNSEFTASVLVASARAAYRMAQAGDVGCKTMFDIPPVLLSAMSGEELRASML